MRNLNYTWRSMMKILSAKDVAQKTSLSVPHIRRAAKANLFPAPIKLSEIRLGWLEEEIDAWLKQTVLSAREGN